MRRVTLVTLGSPGVRAGKSPAFLVLRGLARSRRSRTKKPGMRIFSRNVASARSSWSGGKSRDRSGCGCQGVREADPFRRDARDADPDTDDRAYGPRPVRKYPRYGRLSRAASRCPRSRRTGMFCAGSCLSLSFPESAGGGLGLWVFQDRPARLSGRGQRGHAGAQPRRAWRGLEAGRGRFLPPRSGLRMARAVWLGAVRHPRGPGPAVRGLGGPSAVPRGRIRPPSAPGRSPARHSGRGTRLRPPGGPRR